MENNKQTYTEEIESVCPNCAGRTVIVNKHITKKGKKCPKCEGEGKILIYRKIEKV